MAILKGPQAAMAMSMGIGRRMPQARSLKVRASTAEAERVLAAWDQAREKGKKRSKRNGVHLPPEAPAAAQETAQDPAQRDHVENLPAAYLALCVREARRRLDEEVKRRSEVEVIAQAFAETALTDGAPR